MKETQSQVLYEGLVTGLVGYVTVALVGASGRVRRSVVTPGAVFAYNGSR